MRRCLKAGVLAGDELDIAHVLVALAQGLAAQESAGWLGRSKASVERRWTLAVRATLAGLAPWLITQPPRASHDRSAAHPPAHTCELFALELSKPTSLRLLPRAWARVLLGGMLTAATPSGYLARIWGAV